MPQFILTSSDQKTRCHPKQRNTFGLAPGPGPEGSCPGATDGVGGCWEARGPHGRRCYAQKLCLTRPTVRRNLAFNTKLVKEARPKELERLFRDEFERFENECLKLDIKGGWCYRIHWSGDVPDLKYAKALGAAMREFPNILFWGYTRTLDEKVLRALSNPDNAVWFVSADVMNYEKAEALWKTVPGLGMAYLSSEKPWKLDGRTPIACPVDAGTMDREGACQKCRLCLRRNAVIWFKLR